MICRRSLLFAGAFLATSVKIPNLLAKDNPRRLALWAGSPPGGGGPNGPTDISKAPSPTSPYQALRYLPLTGPMGPQ